MRCVLGIDAAWTARQPSGVALVVERGTGWQCIAVAPSYEEFLAQAEGDPTGWARTSFTGTVPDATRLLRAAEGMSGTRVDVVAVDMPVSRSPFTSRRPADDAISREFGARGCSAHSPNAMRPGPLGEQLSRGFASAGYPVATTSGVAPRPSLIEVYPHPALLSLLKRDRRVPYKSARTAKYWPDGDVRTRIHALLREFDAIHSALASALGSLPFELPPPASVPSLARLKRYEDALDALVCAWVGIEYLHGRTRPLGDETAAIWCPVDVLQT